MICRGSRAYLAKMVDLRARSQVKAKVKANPETKVQNNMLQMDLQARAKVTGVACQDCLDLHFHIDSQPMRELSELSQPTSRACQHRRNFIQKQRPSQVCCDVSGTMTAVTNKAASL